MSIFRQRIIEAMTYFADHVKYPSKMMMYKLLAELDFRHFEETGLPVTNLEYEAWKFGPVPAKLDKEITSGEDLVLPKDFKDALSCEKIDYEKEGKKRKLFLYRSKRKPNLKIFSPRQQRLLKDVADIYKDTTPTTASKASHEPNKPWTKTVEKNGREGDLIDYLDQLSKQSPVNREEAQEMINEILAFQNNYHHS